LDNILKDIIKIMKTVKDKILLKELKKMAEKNFGNLVKAVVDVERGLMAVDANMHADQETHLLKMGSKQNNLWGINIYPDEKGKDRIEFDSVINIRPNQDNNSRGVDNKEIRKKVRKIVNKLIS
jgi:hypothetical protein